MIIFEGKSDYHKPIYLVYLDGIYIVKQKFSIEKEWEFLASFKCFQDLILFMAKRVPIAD